MVSLQEEEQEEFYDVARVDLVKVLGFPLDVDRRLVESFDPFLGKIMHLSNLSREDMEDLKDDLELFLIERRRGLRRHEVSRRGRLDFVRARAYSTAAMTLSRNGYLIDRTTTVYKHVTYDSEQRKAGGLFSVFRRD
ncbi:MAG: hypothetical protein GXO00_00830 [Candidatus Diapherotrites archaeon]|nr:hypothetical protein [Candidatus Diapherotrites archaeon]